jgi:hypothetical protein
MPQDPGPFVKLQVTPISAATPAPAPMATYSQPAITAQEVIIVERPTYVTSHRSHYTRPYYPPAGFNLQWGYPSYPQEGPSRHWR